MEYEISGCDAGNFWTVFRSLNNVNGHWYSQTQIQTDTPLSSLLASRPKVTRHEALKTWDVDHHMMFSSQATKCTSDDKKCTHHICLSFCPQEKDSWKSNLENKNHRLCQVWRFTSRYNSCAPDIWSFYTHTHTHTRVHTRHLWL